ncbi:MAG: RNA polymerase sigma factor [Leptospirales bacterium]|nr:RNA polymerase sigma factor [Leptospirales bacterium]
MAINFNDFYSNNKNHVMRFLYAFVRNEAVCEELTQEVFLKIYSKKDDRYICPYARSYLFTVARTTALDYIRKEKIRNRRFQEAGAEAGLDEIFSSSLEDYYIEGEIISNLHEAINAFPENERKIFIETQIERRVKKEVIEEYNISLYKINKIREKVARSIKKKLRPYYAD